jgi:hypothetical protein
MLGKQRNTPTCCTQGPLPRKEALEVCDDKTVAWTFSSSEFLSILLSSSQQRIGMKM